MPETQTQTASGEERALPKEAKPVLGPEQARLEVFVGAWRGEGSGAGSRSTPMTADEAYQRLEGGFFLTATFDQHVGEMRHTGVGTLGWDAEAGVYRNHMADNLGYERDYEVRDEGGGRWTFTGERERATYLFGADGSTAKVVWEHRPDGRTWSPLCEFELKKAGRAN